MQTECYKRDKGRGNYGMERDKHLALYILEVLCKYSLINPKALLLGRKIACSVVSMPAPGYKRDKVGDIISFIGPT